MKLVFRLLVLAVLFASCGKEEQRPNIIFIMSDDHTTAAIGAYDGTYKDIAPTPNIDRIANEGVQLNNTYCTNAICGPSRAAILTGKYSHVNGFYKNEGGGDFDGTQQTFPKILQKAGYQTAVIGKWHLGSVPTGFDYSKVMINHGGQGTYFNTVYLENGKDTIRESKHTTTQVTDDALKWLKSSRDKNKPFMLMYQFKAPHRPWEPDPKYKDLFEDMEIPEPESFNDNWEGRPAMADNWQRIDLNLNPRDLKVKAPEGLSKKEEKKFLDLGNNNEQWSPDTLKYPLESQELKKWKFQRYIKDYLKCIVGVDEQIGRVLDYLDKSGLADNTIVVYTSDQGFYIGEKGLFDKRFMYEESSKMPFVIRYPEKLKKGKNNNVISNIDFAPTLLDFAGVDIPADIQGKSFKKILTEGEDDKWRDSYYYHYYEFPFWHHIQPHYGIRTNKYKLIHYYYSMDVWELYDLENDPKEMNNIYSESNKELIEELKTELKQLQKEYKMDKSLDELKAMTDARIMRRHNLVKVQ